MRPAADSGRIDVFADDHAARAGNPRLSQARGLDPDVHFSGERIGIGDRDREIAGAHRPDANEGYRKHRTTLRPDAVTVARAFLPASCSGAATRVCRTVHPDVGFLSGLV